MSDVRTLRVCPAPDCDREIAPTSTCCLTHWRALPKGLRVKINQQANHEHNLAVQMAKAQRVWAGEPPPLRRGELPPGVKPLRWSTRVQDTA